MADSNPSLLFERNDALPTNADRTRRIYDRVAALYPASTFFFHSRAHKYALRSSGLKDGMRVLEVATGSGEMFRRLVQANPRGCTFGLDLSPNMAARTQRRAREEFPDANAHCEAVDVRHMPFRDESFDSIFCCYLLELLSTDDIRLTLGELARVLRPHGTLTIVLIGQRRAMFNRAYRVCGKVAPAFWGRQIEQNVPELLEAAELCVAGDAAVSQGFYPSRVLTVRKKAILNGTYS